MKTGKARLRRALSDDVPALQKIERAARQRYRSIPALAFVTEAPAIAEERFTAGVTLVAELDGQSAGYALFESFDGMTYLANIAVSEAFGRRGIGQLLVSGVERYGRAAGTDGIALTTFRVPAWNGPYFRKLGFDTMSASLIGPRLQAILSRHSTFLDMTSRETLWRPIAAQAASTIAQ